MKHITQTLLLLITLTFFTACEKEDPLAACKADPTCEYFRCKVDGKEWRPDCESAFLGCDAVDVQYYRDLNGGGLSIIAKNSNDTSGIKLTATVKKENINYKLFRKNIKSEYYQILLNEWDSYLVDTTLNNEIFFTKIDTINYLIEGTYEFTGINESGELKTITDGEFRQQYRF